MKKLFSILTTALLIATVVEAGGYSEASIYHCQSSRLSFNFYVGEGQDIQLQDELNKFCLGRGNVTRMDQRHCYASANMFAGCRMPISSVTWDGCFLPEKSFSMKVDLLDNSGLNLICTRLKKGGDYNMDGTPYH